MLPLVSSIARASRLDLFRQCLPSSARCAGSLTESSRTTRFVNDGRWPGPLTKQGLPSMRSAENKARLEELGFNNLDELCKGHRDGNVGASGPEKVITNTAKSTQQETSKKLDAAVDSGTSSAGVSDPVATGEEVVVGDGSYARWLLGNGVVDARGCFLRWSEVDGVSTVHIHGKKKDVKHCREALTKAQAATTSSKYRTQAPAFRSADGNWYSPIQVTAIRPPPVHRRFCPAAVGSIAYSVPEHTEVAPDSDMQRVPRQYSRWEVLGSDNDGDLTGSAGGDAEPASEQTEEIQKRVRSVLVKDSCRYAFVVHARLGAFTTSSGECAVSCVPGSLPRVSKFSPSVPAKVQQGLERLLPEECAAVNTLETVVTLPGSSVCRPDQRYVVLEEIRGDRSCATVGVFQLNYDLAQHHTYDFPLPRHQLDVRFSTVDGALEQATDAERAEVLAHHGTHAYLADGCLRILGDTARTGPTGLDLTVQRRGTKLSKRYLLGDGLVLERGRLHFQYARAFGSVLSPRVSCDFVNVVPEVLAVAAPDLHQLGQPLSSAEVEQCVDAVPRMLDSVFRLSRGEAPIAG